ncbi:hypothetical protein S7711_04503 [Stachybotrys chartarum IBT 7711]|uniref:AB hydrolase-1 domain-containing protein n=1 Tax=Stachybotrys chartarum (strain CBS 109288 / IBT 7711) TaxID=1280523 RepID=A0A084BA88_STACB|nr:hypothetical protein S7711_04503 [Stachybotrys chartarum IBT 7711]
MGIAYYGAKSGPTVFYLHGFPGCRFSGVFFDGPGKKLGARVIAVERPGIGISSPQPGRKPQDHANDIRELAEHLGLKSYGIIGVSGGGLYALACAYFLPEQQLTGVSIVCGMGPADIGIQGMNWSNWLCFKGLFYFPSLVRWLQTKVATALQSHSKEKTEEIVRDQLSRRTPNSYDWLGLWGKDAAVLADPDFVLLLLDFYREHYKQGVDGFMDDGRIFTSDPSFCLQDIRASLPIQMWYSRQDTNVPLRMGEAIAARLKSRPEFYIIEDETHLGLVLKYRHNALERLLEKM